MSVVWFMQGHVSVKHLAPKILMADNYCGRLLVKRLGWAAPAYRRKEGATQHLGACKCCLLYDRRPDGRIGVRFAREI